ncbi:Cysteine-rich receptor-like protein kinase 6 [Camellia lanceoleosa]|uniref:Cysteine-rich receptor-like protein kinase 6 n=1 Tax=Camellia lanceoleosa TaxID=1840588 RepID=A0ACC0GI26_9ERIC|nr:Cysteine-rich receptor-like protein kinase 6 [Camellia lanceoleosa]
MIDLLLVGSCVLVEAVKCIHIGLLCVQENPANRPIISSVVVMPKSDTVTLSPPILPAFSVGRLALKSDQLMRGQRQEQRKKFNPKTWQEEYSTVTAIVVIYKERSM